MLSLWRSGNRVRPPNLRLPIVGLGVEGGGGYQVRGVLDYGDWPVHRPATAIQGEGAAYWTRRVSVVRDAALSALAYVEPPSSVQESKLLSAVGRSALPCAPVRLLYASRRGLVTRCLRSSVLARGGCSAGIF